MVSWDEPQQGKLRASDEYGRIVGRVNRTPLSTEYTAIVGYKELGAYVSEAAAKAAVERALAVIERRYVKESA